MPDAKDYALTADPVALLAELERVHGPEVAAIAFRSITGADPPRLQVSRSTRANRKVGVKHKATTIGQTRLLREGRAGRGIDWHEFAGPGADDGRPQGILAFRDNYRGRRNKSGLPHSGAPLPPSARRSR